MVDFILDIDSGLYNFGRGAAGIGLIGSAISSPDLICAMPRRLAHISYVICLMIASEHDNAVPFFGTGKNVNHHSPGILRCPILCLELRRSV